MLEESWAAQEFGSADLGDIRRTERLVRLAAAAARRPSGFISEVVGSDAERTAAYRFVNNHGVRVSEVSAAARRACRQRAAGLPFVFVAEDGSSINVSDGPGWRETGVVGTHTQGARGFIIMNAIVLAPDGTPLGVGGQRWWARAEEPVELPAHKRRPEEKEIRHWVDVAQDVSGDFAEAQAPRPWFQFDRGGDAWYVLEEAAKREWWLTVRMSNDRRLDVPADADCPTVRSALEKATLVTTMQFTTASGHGKAARDVKIEVRACAVTLRLTDDRTERQWPRQMWGVRAREIGAPNGQEPLEWVLLTTRPVETPEDACLTVEGYRFRWRVEEFHRSWKSAGCTVEATQLSTAHAVEVWASILASVAIRILRLTYFSRTNPDAPASVEFTEPEIEAAFKMNRRRRDKSAVATIRLVTWLIAKGGGHAPNLKGVPPGAEVLARGLARHAIWVEAANPRGEEEM